jgi:2'-5' RNA ligase
VLAVDLIDRQGGIGSLQGALSAGLEAGGWYRPEQRPFRPHVSVARVPGAARIPRRELVPPPSLAFTAGPVTLFRSRLSPSGARYEALARFGS